jgi:hypothetical protein
MGFLESLLRGKAKADVQLDEALTSKTGELAALMTKMRTLSPYKEDQRAKLDELRGQREQLLAAIYDLESKRHGAAYAEKHKLLRSKHPV